MKWIFTCCFLVASLLSPLLAEDQDPPLFSNTHFYYIDGKGDEIRHGQEIKKFPDGRNQMLGTWVKGKRHGTWTTWHPNNIKALEENYEADNLDGQRTEWSVSGQKIRQEFFSQGLRQGEFKEWYESGALMTQAQYLHGALDGLMRQWHANGKKSLEVHYKGGKKNGNLLSWDENGEELPLKLYRNDRELKSYVKMEKYPNGQPKEAFGYFVDENGHEVKHGKYDKWFPNGEPWIHAEYYFDKLHGEFQYGKKDGLDYRLENYDKGVKHGRFVWFRGGQQIREEFWDNGVRVHEKVN